MDKQGARGVPVEQAQGVPISEAPEPEGVIQCKPDGHATPLFYLHSGLLILQQIIYNSATPTIIAQSHILTSSNKGMGIL